MKMNVKIKKIDKDSRLQKLRDFVRARGLRWTRQRELIASEFLSQKSHITAEELYDRVKRKDPGVGYSTVYRTLKLAVSAEVASLRKFQRQESVFEPHALGEHHDHLICLGCGRIIEFENAKIEALQREVARDHNFRIKEHRLVLYGYCEKCGQSRRDRDEKDNIG